MCILLRRACLISILVVCGRFFSVADHSQKAMQSIIKRTLLDAIDAVREGLDSWRILILDEWTTRILSSTLRMSDLADHGVPLVERLEILRQPFPEKTAVYFISPSTSSIDRLLKDFECGAQYKVAHLFFTSAVGDSEFGRIRSCCNLVERIATLKEIHVDFMVPEPRVFDLGLGMEKLLVGIEGSTNDKVNELLRGISGQLLSLCITLGDFPDIRYCGKHSTCFKGHCRRVLRRMNGVFSREKGRTTQP